MALLCSYCGVQITSKRIKIVHINICQKPSINYFCNRDCKLNWIFKRPDLELEKDMKGNQVKEEVKSTFDMAVIEDNTDELENYLKDNNIRILRQA